MKKEIMILLILFSLLFGCVQTPEKTTPEKISEISQKLKEEYSKNENPKITLIENADELKSNQKIIYKDSENGMFIVQWSDLLIIYDYENQKIVQEFAITNVNLG